MKIVDGKLWMPAAAADREGRRSMRRAGQPAIKIPVVITVRTPPSRRFNWPSTQPREELLRVLELRREALAALEQSARGSAAEVARVYCPCSSCAARRSQVVVGIGGETFTAEQLGLQQSEITPQGKKPTGH